MSLSEEEKKYDDGQILSVALEPMRGAAACLEDDGQILSVALEPMRGAAACLEVSTDEIYSVKSDPRGHVYVFNYLFTGTGTQLERCGAEKDSESLENTFREMGYRVFLFLDLTKDETYRELERIQKEPELEVTDAFIMCILSRGLDQDTFYSSDMKEMSLQQIQRMFIDGECPQLKRKPRIFFANYCQGVDEERLKCDSIVEVPKDMAVIHDATEGIQAMGSPISGTIFISCLCEVLRELAGKKDLHSIYLKLAEKMKKGRGTTPKLEIYMFKRFFFNPMP